MPKYDVIRVFIASPGDLSEERKLFPSIIEQVNKITAHHVSYHFEPIGSEDTLPNWGRPQQLINQDVQTCDIFLMLLWKRWGTQSGKYSSGTEEEFTLAYARYKKTGIPDLLLYFRSVPEDMMADPGEQLKKIIKFRAKIEKQRICLFRSYNSPDQWKDLLVEHLGQLLDKRKYGREFASEAEKRVITTPADIEGRILELQKQLQDTAAKLETTQAKLRKAAVNYAVEAMKLTDKGDLTLAEEKFAKSLELYEEPEVLSSFGNFLLQIGSIDRAKEKFEKLLRLSEDYKQTTSLTIAYHNLGLVNDIRGDWDQAQEMFERSLEIEQELGNKEGIAKGYTKIAELLYKRGDVDKAEEMLLKALEIDEKPTNRQVCYLGLGAVYRTRGDLDRAEKMFREALQINEKIGNRQGIAKSYTELGLVDYKRGQLNEAEEMLRKALKIDEELGNKESNTYNSLGVIYWEKGDLEQAKEMLRKTLEIARELGNKEDMALAYGNVGNIYLDEGDLGKAEQNYKLSFGIDKELGRKEGIANSLRNLGVIYEKKGDLSKAKEMWAESAQMFREVGDASAAEEIQSWINPT